MNNCNSTLEKHKSLSINCRGRLVDLDKPQIMGILNMTPDSFSDGGRYNSTDAAIFQTEKLIRDGATIIDVGAQSTRPKATFVSAQEEIFRLGNVISAIKKTFPEILISLDTFYGEVVRVGYNEGIDMVNDISAGRFDTTIWSEVAKTKLPYVLMHANPTYESMHDKVDYDDVMVMLNHFFSEKIEQLKIMGIIDVILDPGFGFSKSQRNQLQIVDELQYLGFGEYPILIGVSRKSFIYQPLGKKPLEIDAEVTELHQKLQQKGANIFRVHEPALLRF